MFRGRVTVAEHEKGLARHVRENMRKKDVVYNNRKIFLVFYDLE